MFADRVCTGSSDGDQVDVPVAFLAYAVERGLLEAAAGERARSALLESGQAVDVILSELGLMSETRLAEAQSAFLRLPLASTSDFPDAPLELPDVAPGFLQNAGLLPLSLLDGALHVATATPMDAEGCRALAYFLDQPVDVHVAVKSDFEAALKRLYRPETTHGEADNLTDRQAMAGDLERLKDLAREAPTIRLVSRIIASAVESGASDIHLERTTGGMRVRLRVDGALRTSEDLPNGAVAAVVTRIKILAQLNIAERRLPQDGRMRIALRGRDIDLRVSTTPALDGESVVLRILDRGSVDLDLVALGFDAAQQSAVRELIAAPNGVVLITGPTGSGKTTTLYAALQELNRDRTKIFTVEDPIEYQLDGINQMQVKPAIGLDFPTCLRSILRQDPDVVMIGEIRDGETARIAVQSALTGHLVLSTLHTNSATASIARLLDMGIDDYLVASTLRGIVAQRLVRRVCVTCCAVEDVSVEFWQRLAASPPAGRLTAPRAIGCPACQGTGYAGRTTIAEIMPIDAGMRALILRRAAEADIEAYARKAGAVSLRDSALARVLAGETTLEEAMRITGRPC